MSNTLNLPASLTGLVELALPKIPRFRGEVVLPGSKSIANRAILLAALAEGETELSGLPGSDDVQVLLSVLPKLGITAEKTGQVSKNSTYKIRGSGGPFRVSNVELNLDNAGTAIRPLAAVLAMCEGEYVLDGNEQMRKRPIKDLAQALVAAGADVSCSEIGAPPVRIKTKGLAGGEVKVSGKVSSQFVSALLLAGPLARERDLEILLPDEPVSKPYIDLTIRMMKDFGIEVEREGYRRFRVPRGSYKSPGGYAVEGDASAATYFLALGSLPGSGPITIRGLFENSFQGDIKFADLMGDMGGNVGWTADGLVVSGASDGLRGVDVDMNAMPDAAMTLAVLALFAQGTTYIRNIENLRVKESERILALHTELVKLGATVEEKQDALFITPPETLKTATIATYDDHRMAMAFSLAAFGVNILIENPACVNKTYPEYFHDLAELIDGNS